MAMNYLDENEISKTISKLNLYRKLEDLNFSDIERELGNINMYYKTKNTNKLNNVIPQVKDLFTKMMEYNFANISVYQRNLQNYHQSDELVTEILDIDV